MLTELPLISTSPSARIEISFFAFMAIILDSIPITLLSLVDCKSISEFLLLMVIVEESSTPNCCALDKFI